MGLKRQAKILTKGQTEAVLAYLTSTRYPERNRAIFLLSVRAGMRAKEIASLTWAMLTDAEGKILIESKWGRLGRFIHTNEQHCYLSTTPTYYHTRRGGHLLRGLPGGDQEGQGAPCAALAVARTSTPAN